MKRLLNRGRTFVSYITIIWCGLIISGCSALLIERNFTVDTGGDQWKKNGKGASYHEELARFQNTTITLNTNSTYRASTCPVTIGPPLFPVFPLFLICLADINNLSLRFVLENSSDRLKVDFKGIRLTDPTGRALPIDRAYYCSVARDSRTHSCRNWQEKKPISAEAFMLSKGRYVFELDYTGVGSPEKLTLEFGDTFSVAGAAKVPPVIFLYEFRDVANFRNWFRGWPPRGNRRNRKQEDSPC